MATIEFQHDVWQIRTVAFSHINYASPELSQQEMLIQTGYVVVSKQNKDNQYFIDGGSQQHFITVGNRPMSLDALRREIQPHLQRIKNRLQTFRNQQDMSEQLLRCLQTREGLSDIHVSPWRSSAIFDYKFVSIPLLRHDFPKKGAILMMMETIAEHLPNQNDRALWKRGLVLIRKYAKQYRMMEKLKLI